MTEFCYNNAEQITINCSLFFTMYKYNSKIKVDIVNNDLEERSSAVKN